MCFRDQNIIAENSNCFSNISTFRQKLNGVQTFTVTCFTQYNFTVKFQIKLQ